MGRWFEPHRSHWEVSLSKTHSLLLSTGSTQEDRKTWHDWEIVNRNKHQHVHLHVWRTDWLQKMCTYKKWLITKMCTYNVQEAELAYRNEHIWAVTWDFQQCGICDQQRLRPACAYAQSDQSHCKSLEYSKSVKLYFYQTLWGVTVTVNALNKSRVMP